LTLGAFLLVPRRAAALHGFVPLAWLGAAAVASWLLTLPDVLPLIAAALFGGALVLVPPKP